MYKKLIFLIVFIFMVGIAGSGYADLVGHWRLDEGSGMTVSDSSGNGNDGTITNNPNLDDTTWIAGLAAAPWNSMAIPRLMALRTMSIAAMTPA